MRFVVYAFHWFWGNTQPIFHLRAAISVAIAVATYWKNSALERACWLSSLYTKFYEAPDLKFTREVLDCNPPDSPEVKKLVEEEDARFSDYLNFFEFMAYLKACGQLSQNDIAALFDYYLRILSKHGDARKYGLDDRNGYAI